MRQSDTVHEFADPNTLPADPDADGYVKFRFGADVYTLRRPKLSLAVQLVTLVEGGEIAASATTSDVTARLMQTLWALTTYVDVEDPEPLRIEGVDGQLVDNPNGGRLRGQGRLLQRLRDPHDRFDVLDLAEPFALVAKAMFDRPTGPSPASSAKRAGDGNDSAAASPAPPAATSGT